MQSFGYFQQQGTPSPLSSFFESSYKDRVYKIYEQVNPKKLTQLDSIMEKYEGKEEELIKKLERQYGVKDPSKK